MRVSSKILMIFLTTLTISCAASVPVVPTYVAPVAPVASALGLWPQDGDYCLTESSVRELWQFREDYKAYVSAVKETCE